MKRKRPAPKPKQLAPGPKYAGVYRAAAKRIRERGWCHHGGMNRQGNICLLIAIVGAAKDLVPEGRSSLPALHAARVLDPDVRQGSAFPLIAYNDAPERTEAEVLDLLARLAA